MGLVGRLMLSLVLVVLLLATAAGLAYMSDYVVEATVVDKSCKSPIPQRGDVTVEAKVLGLQHTVTNVPAQQCAAVNAGNFVVYRIRSERVSLYQSEGGACIYDSAGGVA